MIRFLADLLTPVFGSYGVSPVDVQTYADMLSGYIYAIFGTLLLAAAVMVAAHWLVKKGARHVVRWSAGLAWVLIVTVLANVICFGPMYNNIAPILNIQGSVSEASATASREIMVETGEEGIAMVKNTGVLPLAKNSTVNVFGWASTNPIYGGTGSGSADNSNAVDILTSLKDAGFTVNQSLVDLYVEYSPVRNLAGPGQSGVDWSLPEPPIEKYTDALMNEAKDFSDKAIIVLSRSGGEGQDEPNDMNALIHGTYDVRNEVANGNPNYGYYDARYTNNGNYDDFDQGEHYLELSNTEEAMIEKVCAEFSDVVVVINANNTMELGWVDQYDSIGAVLLVPGTGASAMQALGSILCGDVNPSGRTVDTYVYDLFSTPTANNAGNFTFNNVSDLQAEFLAADDAFQGALAFVNYVENIYVGYRFYETAAEEGLIDYDSVVQYPFGHGLSYTTFDQKITSLDANGSTLTVEVTVTNTGSVDGKTAVELYYTPPYTNGGIEKASVNLADFAKTAVLAPGAAETVKFEIAYEDLAAYDSQGVKTANGGYVLEAGEYGVSVRANSHEVLDERTFTVDRDIDYSVDGRSSDGVTANNRFQDYSVGNVTYLSRKDGFANYTQATAAPAESAFVMDDETRELVAAKSTARYDSTLYDNPSDVMPTTGAKNGLKVIDLRGKDYDDPQWDDLLDQLTVEDMINMVNLGGFQTVAVDSIGKVGTQDSDGTSGLNDWYIQVYGTAYPTELLIAQTWNKELAYRIGQAEGQEYADCGIYGTYSPAMNTHRSAFCGRNFEYYSEDPVLAGHIAANTVNGLADKGVYAYIKHFVMNDQETNRCCLLLTYSDEQAIREIYMKPFEICVKNFEGQSLAVMSSFNFIGPKWCGANPDLLNGVLRDEWGFRGMVLTDWDGSYGYQNTDDCVRNGNDAMLGFFSYPSNEITNTSASVVKAMRQSCKNILYTVANSGNYANGDPTGGMDKTVYVQPGKTIEVEWENTPITGQFQIRKYAAEYNEVTGTPAGAPLKGAVYEISEARSGRVVDYITTDARGVAASKPLPLTRYLIKEVTAPAYWQLSGTVFDETLEYAGQIIKLSDYDKPAKLGVTITKRGNAQVLAGSQMRYDITVANTSNVPLSEFYWHDRIPTDATRATVLTTGTYSARLNYRVLYKTNCYQVLASNLLTSSNYSFSLNAIPMQAGEYVTDVYFDFGKVPVSFQSLASPTLTVQVLGTVANNYQIINRADVGGKYQGTWQTAQATWLTIVRRLGPVPTLPQTGY